MKRIIIALAIVAVVALASWHESAHATTANALPQSMVEINQCLSQGEEAYNAGDYTNALRHFLEAEKSARRINDKEKKSEIYFDIATTYFMISAHGEALEYFYRALQECPDEGFGYEIKIQIIYGIAGVYYKDGDNAKALELLQPYYQEVIEKNDSVNIVEFSTFMSMVANRDKQYDRALELLQEGRKYCTPNSEDEAWMASIESTTRYRRGEYDDVQRIWGQMLANPTARATDLGYVAIYMMKIATEKGQYTQAKQYAAMADSLIMLSDKPLYFASLADLREKQHDLPGVIAAKDSLILYKDSLEKIANRTQLNATRSQLEVLEYSNKSKAELRSMRHRTRLAIFIASLSFMAAIIAFVLFRFYRVRSKSRHKLAEMQLQQESNERQLAEERLKISELEAKIKEEQLKTSLEEQQRELSATSMFNAARTNLVEEVLKQIEESGAMSGSPKLLALHRQLQASIKGDDANEEFIIKFEKANPDFYRRVLERHPELLQSDLHFLAYIRMNLSMKDIASMLNINPDSCKRRKIRISKKLDLPTSADLYAYVNSL